MNETKEMEVLQEMHDKLTQSGKELDHEMEAAKEKYYINYFKKVIEKLPISQDIVDTTTIQDTHEGFIKTYSIANTCVNIELQCKKTIAFNSIYDMLTGIVSKIVHDKFIVPNIASFIPKVALQHAFSIYQNEMSVEDECTELHCISYLIQNEIESKQSLKVPNPIYNRITHQMTAVSKYITEILKSVAFKIPKELVSESTSEREELKRKIIQDEEPKKKRKLSK